jgi:hypothetical protein
LRDFAADANCSAANLEQERLTMRISTRTVPLQFAQQRFGL